MKLHLHATPRDVMRAVEALQQLGLELKVPGGVLFGLALALEECGSNIVSHALRRDEGKTFTISIEHAGGALVMELRDCGPAFDPTLQQAAQEAEDDEQHGGWGIRLARAYTDEILYAREGEENVLRLIKRITPATGEAPVPEHNTGRKP